MRVLRRLGALLLLLIALSAVLFALLSAMPGDPVDMLITSNPQVRPEDVARLKKLRGLDRPLPYRYWRWLYGSYDGMGPPRVEPSSDIITERTEADDVITVRIPLAAAATDPNVTLSEDEVRALLTAHAPAQAEALAAREGTAAAWLDAAAVQDAKLFAGARAAITQKASAAITWRGLFGTTIERDDAGLPVAVAAVAAPGVHAVWVVAETGGAQEAARRTLVYVAPPTSAGTNGVPDEDADEDGASIEASPDDASRDDAFPAGDDATGHDRPLGDPPDDADFDDQDEDEERLAAGGEDVREVVPRDTDALRAAATDAGGLLRVVESEARIIERDVPLRIELSTLVEGARGALTFEHESGPGRITAHGTLVIDEPVRGQRVVAFVVRDVSGAKAPGALAVEGEPIADPSRFHRGVVFALLGDTEALGFSNLYKRPVWSLLAGAEDRCGDGFVDLGEMCDAGPAGNSECSTGCVRTGAPMWTAWKHRAAGALYRSGRIANTFMLMVPALLLALLIALPAGIVAAVRQYSPFDYVMSFLAFVGISIFVAWFAQMAIALFAEGLQWLPASGIQEPATNGDVFDVAKDRLRHMVLPTAVLAIAYAGSFFRYMRGAMLEVLPADFIRTARAKGLSGTAVILKHALKNAMLPVVTVVALTVPRLFGGALLTETVFSWPGIGRLQYDAVMSNDYYVAIVVFLISAALVMGGNLVADLLYTWLDPRTRRGRP